MKFAYTADSDITLDLDTCSAQARLSVVNAKPLAVKYVDYYCNVVVIVPEDVSNYVACSVLDAYTIKRM